MLIVLKRPLSPVPIDFAGRDFPSLDGRFDRIGKSRNQPRSKND